MLKNVELTFSVFPELSHKICVHIAAIDWYIGLGSRIIVVHGVTVFWWKELLQLISIEIECQYSPSSSAHISERMPCLAEMLKPYCVIEIWCTNLSSQKLCLTFAPWFSTNCRVRGQWSYLNAPFCDVHASIWRVLPWLSSSSSAHIPERMPCSAEMLEPRCVTEIWCTNLSLVTSLKCHTHFTSISLVWFAGILLVFIGTFGHCNIVWASWVLLR